MSRSLIYISKVNKNINFSKKNCTNFLFFVVLARFFVENNFFMLAAIH